MHSVRSCTASLMYLPSGQSTHLRAAGSVNCPRPHLCGGHVLLTTCRARTPVHGVQEAAPSCETVATAQCEQLLAPRREYLPAAHGVIVLVPSHRNPAGHALHATIFLQPAHLDKHSVSDLISRHASSDDVLLSKQESGNLKRQFRSQYSGMQF